jgi:hypothetical protein
MPWPVGPVAVGVHGENHALHKWVDAVAGGAAVGVRAISMGSLMEELFGHKSGQGTNTNARYDSGTAYRSPAAAAAGVYTIGGTATGTAAGTLTDTAQTWPVNFWTNFGIVGLSNGQFQVIVTNTGTALTNKANWGVTPGATTVYYILALADQNQGGTVTYAAGPANALVDSAKAWVVNQWRGYWVWVNAELHLIVSNTATQLTLDRAWSAQPANNQSYGILLPAVDNFVSLQRGTGSTTGINQQGGNNNNPLNV